jgi:hypothetical protein
LPGTLCSKGIFIFVGVPKSSLQHEFVTARQDGAGPRKYFDRERFLEAVATGTSNYFSALKGWHNAAVVAAIEQAWQASAAGRRRALDRIVPGRGDAEVSRCSTSMSAANSR